MASAPIILELLPLPLESVFSFCVAAARVMSLLHSDLHVTAGCILPFLLQPFLFFVLHALFLSPLFHQ